MHYVTINGTVYNTFKKLVVRPSLFSLLTGDVLTSTEWIFQGIQMKACEMLSNRCWMAVKDLSVKARCFASHRDQSCLLHCLSEKGVMSSFFFFSSLFWLFHSSMCSSHPSRDCSKQRWFPFWHSLAKKKKKQKTLLIAHIFVSRNFVIRISYYNKDLI